MSLLHRNLLRLEAQLGETARVIVAHAPPAQQVFPDRKALDAEAEATLKAFVYERVPRLIILYGIGYGALLHALLRNPPPQTVEFLVIEQDPALCALALSLYDLSPYASSRNIKMLVGVSPDALRAHYQNYLYERNRYLYLESFVAFSEQASLERNGAYYLTAATHFKEYVATFDRGLGNTCEDNFIGISKMHENAPAIVASRDISVLKGAYRGRPGIVVSSGPSLSLHIETLKKLQDKAVLVAADSAISRLYNADIVAPYISTLERTDGVAYVFGKIPAFKGGTLIAASLTHPRTLAKFQGEIVYFQKNENISYVYPFSNAYINSGPSCGNLSFALLDYFGCDPIYLVGQDLAYDRTTKQSHFADCISLDITKKYEELQQNAAIMPKQTAAPDIHHNSVTVNLGNDGNPIETTHVWQFFREHFEQQIAAHRGTVYNAIPATSGARIAGATRIDNLDLLQADCAALPPLHLVELPQTSAERKAADIASVSEKIAQYLEQLGTIEQRIHTLQSRLDAIAGAPLELAIAAIDELTRDIDELRKAPAYSDLLFAVGLPLFVRDLIETFKWDKTFHGNAVFVRERTAQFRRWSEETLRWTTRCRDFFTNNPIPWT